MTFIVFEGIDHVGKGTQIELLNNRLRELGYDVLLTRAPGDAGVLDCHLRNLMASIPGIHPLTRTFLMMADLSQQMRDVVVPAIEAGKIVIGDRFTFSCWAYQGAGHNIDDWMLQEMSEQCVGGNWPDLTFYLDMDPETWKTRKKVDDPDGQIESSDDEYIEKVRQGYIEKVVTFSDGNVKPIDASGTREEVHEEIWKYVNTLLKKNKSKPKTA